MLNVKYNSQIPELKTRKIFFNEKRLDILNLSTLLLEKNSFNTAIYV